MRRADDRDVPAVEGRHLGEAEALGGGDDAGVDPAAGQVGAAGDRHGDARRVEFGRRLDPVPAAPQPRGGGGFGAGAEPGADEAARLGQDEGGHDERR